MVEHQPHVDGLAVGIGRQHLAAAGNGAAIAALLGVALGQLGQHGQEPLAQPLPLGECPVLVEILCEEIAPVEGVGGLVGSDGLGQRAALLAATAPLGAGLELQRINPAVGIGVEGVAARDGEDEGGGFVGVEGAAQLADAHMEAAASGIGVVIGPEDLQQLVAGHDAPPTGQQCLENGAGLLIAPG